MKDKAVGETIVKCTVQEKEYTLCTLSDSMPASGSPPDGEASPLRLLCVLEIPQVNVDLTVFPPDESVLFTVVGKNAVDITGTLLC